MKYEDYVEILESHGFRKFAPDSFIITRNNEYSGVMCDLYMHDRKTETIGYNMRKWVDGYGSNDSADIFLCRKESVFVSAEQFEKDLIAIVEESRSCKNMVVKWKLFKPSGKLDHEGTSIIPISNIYDDGVVDLIMGSQTDITWNYNVNNPMGAHLLVENGNYTSNVFFTHLYEI